MKRRREQERDEAIAREQADARREALLADLRARQAGEPEPAREPEPADEPEPARQPDAAREPDAEEAAAAEQPADESAEGLPAD
ncbi:MAG: hypothetical protein ACXWMN_08175 [Candidatus Limnocylindria bacterium]